jgi:hypothetical protein
VSERLRRLTAIVKADLLIRFRRLSTVVVFLLLSAFAYVWIPDPATGRALLQIEGKRAVYNSAAIGMATASLGTIFIGLVGFYVISNALRRDVLSRCGFVIASTTMRAPEYLIGKVAGNIVFLTTFMGGFMVSSMAMLLVRGEAALEPLIFAKQYLLLVPPTIVAVSVVAIVFESIPFLSGKFGDVVYFFLWIASLGIVASNVTASDPGILGYFDISGFGYLKAAIGTEHLSIGSSNFDASKGLYVFHGLALPEMWIAPRIGSTVVPFLLLPIAILFFHRFDPARLRKAALKTHRSWLSRLGALAKPLARRVYGLAMGGGGSSLLAAARTDALMSLSAFPLSILVVVAFGIAALATPAAEVTRGILPVAFAAAAILIADVPSREQRAGTVGLLYAAPRLKSRFVLWKFVAAVFICVTILIGPIVKLALARPGSLPALLTGLVFVAAIATALGVISSNPKTFLVVFLTFWYVVMSDKGASPALDFAGFFGTTTVAVMLGYLAGAFGALAAAEGFHAVRLRRA